MERHRVAAVVPVIEEELSVGVVREEKERVVVTKTVESEHVVLEAPAAREDVTIERVAIGREIESAPAVRTEGSTTIIPVVEEVVVVQKKLVLREEIRITKTRVEGTRELHAERLRERAQIQRLGAPDANGLRSGGADGAVDGDTKSVERRRT